MRTLFALAALLLASVGFAATPTISLNPSTGVAPYSSTLTWNGAGAANCTASGAWTGAKALTGTQQVTVSAATPFTLTCSYADGKTTTVWTPPATNTDGSQYTDNAGYNIYRGTTATNLAKVKSVGPTVTSYDDTGLASGSYYYDVTSVNSASLESVHAKATPFPIQVTGTSQQASVTPGIQTIPSAPGGVIVTTTSTDVSVSVKTTTGVATASQ